MLKKTVTYENFDGSTVTEDFYFNLTTPELTRLMAECDGDIQVYAEKLAKSGDGVAMIEFLEKMILRSFGIKSDDGKRFVKTPKVREDFEYSAAYAELFEQLMTQPTAAQQFGAGLVHGAKSTPNAEAAKMLAERNANVTPIV